MNLLINCMKDMAELMFVVEITQKEIRRCSWAKPRGDSARYGKEAEEDPRNAGEAEGEDSRAGLSWGGKPSHTPSPGGTIQLMALQALKNTKHHQRWLIMPSFS